MSEEVMCCVACVCVSESLSSVVMSIFVTTQCRSFSLPPEEMSRVFERANKRARARGEEEAIEEANSC